MFLSVGGVDLQEGGTYERIRRLHGAQDFIKEIQEERVPLASEGEKEEINFLLKRLRR